MHIDIQIKFFQIFHPIIPKKRKYKHKAYNILKLLSMKLTQTGWGCPRGVMVKAMDCGIVVSEFELQLRYYVHFRANTLGKGINPLILHYFSSRRMALALNNLTKVDMPLNKETETKRVDMPFKNQLTYQPTSL